MKKIISLLLIAALLCLCGCQKNSSEDKQFEVIPQKEFQSKEEPQLIMENDPSVVGATPIPPYDPKDHTNLGSRNLENGIVHDGTPKTTSQLIKTLGSDGLIVTGTAYGLREGVYRDPCNFYTRTTVEIDKVFRGDVNPGDSIIVNEDYVMMNDESGDFIYSFMDEYSYLKNGEYVLMFLSTPTDPDFEGYFPAILSMPVEQDCDEWSEEYLESFLNYFRGDTSTYKCPEKNVYLYNGYPVLETPPGWPKRDISDEELIEEMKENVLFYIATELKIKIWPTEHVNYTGNHTGSAANSMTRWQYPKAQAEYYLR